MKIKRFIGGLLESNGYIIYQKDGGDAYLIDPGYNSKVFIEYIREHGFSLKGILLTHYHYDHSGVADRVKAAFDCPIYLHRRDCDIYFKEFKRNVDIYMEDGDVFDLEGEEIRVIHTPGHTGGGVCFMSEKSKVCFTGDTIFNVDLGRTDLEGGSEEEMIDSILNIIDKWPNDIMIYPGHGDGCTMKKVRQINTEFNEIVNKR